ncbi:MAG: deoxyribose-phosphate aldolase [Opitutales bacterium]|nr:deoxyribose-phosphate aldolase [Opitutales bacterium]
MSLDSASFASRIDHTNLRLDATRTDIERLCDEAVEYGFYSVMVYPTSVPLCVERLQGSGVKVGTVIGFPCGRFDVSSKLTGVIIASDQGADEVDVVMNYAMLRDGDLDYVREELEEISDCTHDEKRFLKVIVETCYLTREQRLQALTLCEEACVDMIKTSTGFGSAGASVEHIREWVAARKGNIQIKAAGGIRTLPDALALIEAGADRIGASAAVDFMRNFSA